MPVRTIVATAEGLARTGIGAVLARDSRLLVVGETGDGPEVLSLCRRLRPDLLLLDVHLSRLSGLAVVRLLAADPHRPRILMVSAHADAGSVRLALHNGAAGFLRTAVSGTELLTAVHRVLNGERVLMGVEGMLQEKVPLASQELVILSHVAQGLANKEIAEHLGISRRTVTTHLANICAKLEVSNRVAAVEAARRYGFLSIE